MLELIIFALFVIVPGLALLLPIFVEMTAIWEEPEPQEPAGKKYPRRVFPNPGGNAHQRRKARRALKRRKKLAQV